MQRTATAALLALSLLMTEGCDQQPKKSEAKFINVIASTLMPLIESFIAREVGDMKSSFFQFAREKIGDTIGYALDIGEASNAVAKATATKLNVDLDAAIEQDIVYKLNSIQKSLTVDYIPGAPDSTQMLASLATAATQVETELEAYMSDSEDLKRTGRSIVHYQTYMLIGIMKAAILSERLSMAEKVVGLDPAVLESFKAARIQFATAQKKNLLTLRTTTTDRYVEQKALTYTMVPHYESMDFGAQKSLRFSFCGAFSGGKPLCGPLSPTKCSSDFDLKCVEDAKAEAKALFDAQTLPQLRDEFREKAFGRDMDKYLAELDRIGAGDVVERNSSDNAELARVRGMPTEVVKPESVSAESADATIEPESPKHNSDEARSSVDLGRARGR